jgi:hypothetical protein
MAEDRIEFVSLNHKSWIWNSLKSLRMASKTCMHMIDNFQRLTIQMVTLTNSSRTKSKKL